MLFFVVAVGFFLAEIFFFETHTLPNKREPAQQKKKKVSLKKK